MIILQKGMMELQKNYPLYEVEYFETVREMLRERANKNADTAAFKYDENGKITEVTYGEFYRDIMCLGTALTDMGYTNRHISCIGHNSYGWITVYLTALMSNNVFVPIDKDLPEKDIINVINHGEADIVFCDEKYTEALRNAEFSKNVQIVSLDDGDNGLKKLIKDGEKLIDEGNRLFENIKPNNVTDLKMILYTSGTTGNSKGVMLSEKNVMSCVYSGLRVAKIYDVGLSVLPYHHTYESVCGLLVGIHEAATICINKSLKSVAKNLQLYKPTYIMIVPAFAELFYDKIWNNIRKKGKERGFKLLLFISKLLLKIGIDKRQSFFKEIHAVFGGRLKKIVCGGAPIRPEIAYFFDDIGIPLANGYGITECSPLVSGNRDYFDDPKTAGVPLPCVQVKIDSPDAEGIGEIVVKGDTVMSGYYKEPEKTAEVLIDGWFYTGDYGKFTKKGQLMITGRKKNLIVLTNGKNIFPEEIEEYILSIPEVKEVIVFARRDESGNQKHLSARVFINPETPIEYTALREKISEALSKLPKYKQIQEIIVEEKEFEKTTTNKIKRQKYI